MAVPSVFIPNVEIYLLTKDLKLGMLVLRVIMNTYFLTFYTLLKGLLSHTKEVIIYCSLSDRCLDITTINILVLGWRSKTLNITVAKERSVQKFGICTAIEI